MKQEVGNNIYNDFANTVEIAKFRAEEINNIVNNSLSKCIDMIKKSSSIKDVLNNELILLQNFDINYHNNNEVKIDSRVNLCNIALEEYQLLNNNKEQYLEKVFQRNVFSSKEIDINKDTIFEQSVKKLIVNLGNEKNSSAVSPQLFELYEIRQNKLKEICKEFTLKRQAFLSQHINQEQQHEQIKKKEHNKDFER
ncbi:hypothetical protein [uncultured Brachyspira sp.]|jgi:hypothetical protein|uniref:hypothetical protein n=1 Tax=uncultured Brachyspira sp. TaxID=221953 RepID=UPI0026163098|nr:hypothetical protein [uncultured Brachyspira sp.]